MFKPSGASAWRGGQPVPPHAPRETAPDALSPGEQSPRKPRILAISPAVPIPREAAEPPVSVKRPAPEIPALQFARIRTWVKYGMTAADVAQVYGVAVEEIELILHKA
jgi:hypothetical protein